MVSQQEVYHSHQQYYLHGIHTSRLKNLWKLLTYFFSETTIMKLQTKVLFPSVNKVYEMARSKRVGGCCCDSLGFKAKCGTYTLMNAQRMVILHRWRKKA